MRGEIALPAFAMDCRDWIVVTPGDGMPEDVDGAPLLAMLSTAVIDEADLSSATAVITVGLLDDESPAAQPVASGAVAERILEPDCGDASRRYLLPAPRGSLALLAEFSVDGPEEGEVSRRIDALMTSFRWAA